MHVLAHLEHRFHAVTSIARRVLKVAADVAARTEATPGAGNNDGSHFVVVPRIRERGDDLVDHDLGVSVELGGAIQRYRGDSVLFRVDDLVKIHVNSINNRTYRKHWAYLSSGKLRLALFHESSNAFFVVLGHRAAHVC